MNIAKISRGVMSLIKFPVQLTPREILCVVKHYNENEKKKKKVNVGSDVRVPAIPGDSTGSSVYICGWNCRDGGCWLHVTNREMQGASPPTSIVQ